MKIISKILVYKNEIIKWMIFLENITVWKYSICYENMDVMKLIE